MSTKESIDQSTPVVSVAMTSYNSAMWLARALDSVLQQQTSFPVEIVIGDDCSSDNTVAIAREYEQRYPGVLRILARPKNIGIMHNYYDTFENCRGKYIAWLDADDYWTDPLKLAIQVDAMDGDSSINVTCHYVRMVTPQNEIIREKSPFALPGRYGLNDILRGDFVQSVSVVFRNGLQRKLPPWYFEVAPSTDYPLWLVSSLSGDIVLIDRIMADYIHTAGSAYSKDDIFWLKQHARVLTFAKPMLPDPMQTVAGSVIGKRYEAIAYILRKRGDFYGSRKAAIKAFQSPSVFSNLGSKTKALVAAVVREAEWRFRGQKTTS